MRRWLAALAPGVIVSGVIAPAVVVPAAPARADDTAGITAYLRRHAATHHIPGLAAAVVRDGRVVHSVTLGTDGNGAPVTGQTPFLLGSVSKPVTAVAVMQLVEAGRVELDAPVRRHLPWFDLRDEAAAGAITVRHLLTHTSGLPDIATSGLTDRFDNTPGGLDRTVRDLATIDGTQRPGARHEYSDANYAVLGSLVAAVSGQPFGAYLRQHVLDPLDMRRSAATEAEATAVGLPPGHRMWFGRPRSFDPPFDMSGVPYGYTAASLDDIGHFVAAQLGGGAYGGARILSARGIELTHTGQADVDGGTRYGFGWRDTRGDTRLVWHAGATPGYFSHIVLEPATGTGVAVLSNVYSPALDPALAAAAFDVAAIVRGERPDPAGADPVFMYVLVALSVVAVALLAAIAWPFARRRPRGGGRAGRARATMAATGWIGGTGAVAALAVAGLPATWGAGIREMLLWTPDIGWTAVTVAALAVALGLTRAAGIVLRRPGTAPPPAAPDGRTATPVPDHSRDRAAPAPAPESPRPPR